MNKSFLNISRIECDSVSKETILNANKQLEIAEILAQSREYGAAISHLVIGSEELIKALVLHLDSVGFNLRNIRGMKGVFENHQLRYFISFFIFVVSTTIEELKLLFEKYRNGNITALDLEEMNKKLYEENEDFTKYFTQKILTKIEFYLEELKWFRDFDIFRQKGFYVDYDGKLETPLQATEEKYVALKYRIVRVDNFVKELIKDLNNDTKENSKALQSILKHFNSGVKPEKIENFIRKVNLNKTNALDYTLGVVEPFITDFKEDW